MNPPTCPKCNIDTFCYKNEIEVKDHGQVRYGDLFKCPRCDWMVVTGMGAPVEAKGKKL